MSKGKGRMRPRALKWPHRLQAMLEPVFLDCEEEGWALFLYLPQKRGRCAYLTKHIDMFTGTADEKRKALSDLVESGYVKLLTEAEAETMHSPKGLRRIEFVWEGT